MNILLKQENNAKLTHYFLDSVFSLERHSLTYDLHAAEKRQGSLEKLHVAS